MSKFEDVGCPLKSIIMNLLEIKNLRVQGNGKEILRGVDLEIKRGETHALLGPNACGKSTLAQVISGNPKFKIIQGKIFFNGKNIIGLTPEKRVKLGIVLTWQNPPAIKGARLSELFKETRKTTKEIPKVRKLLKREINVGLSGGEKKMSELFQVLSLSPRLVIFDEIDSGLDLKLCETAAKIIKKEFIAKKVSVLLITHSGEILKFLKPNVTNVMVEGKIICKEKDFNKVLRTIKRYNYEKCKKCKLPANRQ